MFDKVKGIYATDPGRIVITGGGDERWLIGSIRRGQNPVVSKAAWIEAIEGANCGSANNQRQAIYVIVAEGHVVENAAVIRLIAER